MSKENKDNRNFRSTYAATYDLLYAEKDYAIECDFLEEIFRRFAGKKIEDILDMGCGTGGHAIPLARRGYTVVGIDRSPEMAAIAARKAGEQEVTGFTHFAAGDMRDIRLDRTFDAVICMFAVLGYQTSNEGLFAALVNARRHLAKGGLFVCDFWYGPTVLKERPAERIKSFSVEEDRIIRTARPELDAEKNIVTVSYHLLRMRGVQLIEETQEVHEMRYLFLPELEFFLSQAGMELLHVCPFPEAGKHLAEGIWNAAAIARAK